MFWKKPSGVEIETQSDEATRKYCKSLGWKEIKKKDKAKELPISDVEWDEPEKNSEE